MDFADKNAGFVDHRYRMMGLCGHGDDVFYVIVRVGDHCRLKLHISQTLDATADQFRRTIFRNEPFEDPFAIQKE